MRQATTVRCTHLLAQVSLGFFDAEGNLVGEETFPQAGGSVITAKLFHPHVDQLILLIDACVQQAWAKLNAPAPGSAPTGGRNGASAAEPDAIGSEPVEVPGAG